MNYRAAGGCLIAHNGILRKGAILSRRHCGSRWEYRKASMTIIIPGDPATKKNSQKIVLSPNGRPFIRPSDAYMKYRRNALYDIQFMKLKWPEGLKPPINQPVNLKVIYFKKYRYRVDLVNLLEATCDILVDAGILADDNVNIVYSHDGSRVFYDKENPRAEITIEKAAKG